MTEWPEVLYVCDMEPGNQSGGAVLMSRILSGYPVERLSLIVGTRWLTTADAIQGVRRMQFPTVSGAGRFGWGRIRSLTEWMMMPALCCLLLWLIRKRRVEVLVSVPQGRFFTAAAVASALSGVPLVLFLHDDWVRISQRDSWGEKYFVSWLFGRIAKQAAVIYSISSYMRRWLESNYGVASEVLMPCAEPNSGEEAPPQTNTGVLRIAYTGSATEANHDILCEFMRFVQEYKTPLAPGTAIEFHYYGMKPEPEWLAPGNPHKAVFHDWMPQASVAAELRKADVVCLPFSFTAVEEHLTMKSMPAKTSDYLAAGKPVLIIAPRDSFLVEYATEKGFAEIVCDDSRASLIRALEKLAGSPEYRAQLAENARAAFAEGHNVHNQRRHVFGRWRELAARRRN